MKNQKIVTEFKPLPLGTPRLVFREPISVEEILDLRGRVLRKNTPGVSGGFPEDNLPTSRHFEALSAGKAVACLTFIKSSWEGKDAWQLRGMAVDETFHGKGIGRALLEYSIRELKTVSDVNLFWCNARVSAIGFYEKMGWRVASEEFTIEPIGPHRKMVFP